MSGEGGDVDQDVVNHWTENVLPTILERYSEDDIYNADETGLFYCMQPSRTMHYRGERCTGGKQSKERLSVLVCANMSGTEKSKLLVIGKSEKPRCFKNVKTLPVVYRNNTKAWMTSSIFLEWLKSMDKKFRVEKRHCVLLIDNCPSHPNPLPFPLTNLTIHFLPKNTTSHTQPCDAGIIRDLKRKYRTRLVKRMLAQIEASPTASNYKPNVLDAIRMVSAAWDEVKPDTVKNCFRKAGWRKGDENSTDLNDDEDDIPLAVLRERLSLPETMTFEDYINVDSDLATEEVLTEDELFASLRTTPQTTQGKEEEEEEEDEENQTENPVCSLADAKVHLQEVRRYLETCSHTSEIDFRSISALESSLLQTFAQKQKSIRDFFH